VERGKTRGRERESERYRLRYREVRESEGWDGTQEAGDEVVAGCQRRQP